MKINQEVEFNLAQAFKNSISDNGFDASKFFKIWFNHRSNSFYFLFRKNLKVTNIQFSELLSLLRAHSKIISPNGEKHQFKNLHFLSSSEFVDIMEKLLISIPKDTFTEEYIEKFCKLYLSFLSKIIIVDFFFGSCSIFVPYHIEVNVRLICALSGYIHSAGRCVYIRNITKSNKAFFYEAIDNHIANHYSSEKIGFFAVYAHEDFTKYDRAKIDELKNGLDDVKIYVEKFYMGNASLVSILREMTEKYKNVLEIPEPGDYRTIHQRFRQKASVETTKTMWLIIEHSVNKDHLKIPGDKSYFICYDQEYINENPYYIFDENKPAWISHTTVPHTLMSAMINITMPYWNTDQKITLKDPFSGSGTAILEGLKYSNLEVYGSDLESVAPLLAKDNFKFFTLKISELEDISKRLKDLYELLLSPNFNSQRVLGKNYFWALDILEKSGLNRNFYTSESMNLVIEELENSDFFARLLFYIALRANKRHLAAFERQSEHWKDAFGKECVVITQQIENLIKQKKRMSKILPASDDRISIYQGSYSLSCSINFDAISISEDNLKSSDARNIEENSYDLIITDPPYGFNTNSDTFELATLFQEMIRCFIRSLKSEGQIVLCLPDQSKTGRELPYFTQQEFITQQIIIVAEELNCEILNSTFFVPKAVGLFRPPYYWESERALRRSIIHFRIRKHS